MQKPKKVVIIATDGKKYTIMCKPKVKYPFLYLQSFFHQDDLRKDCRLMEFNSVINKVFMMIILMIIKDYLQFLLRDSECRQRHLYIRTYVSIITS